MGSGRSTRSTPPSITRSLASFGAAQPPQIPHSGFSVTARSSAWLHRQLTHVCTAAQSHWKSQGHQRAHFFSDWFNPTHLAFHDPSNRATVMPAHVDVLLLVLLKSLTCSVRDPFVCSTAACSLHALHCCSQVLWNSREHRKGRFVRVATLPNQHVKRPRYRFWGVEPKNISW